ncbi:MAG: pyrroline-5-carboxylate reductase [Peptoniphilaceae bacterium]
MEKIGIIGAGNMGGAIAKALIANNKQIIISNKSSQKLEKYKNIENVEITNSNIDVVKNSKYIILAVKPNIYQIVAKEINKYLDDSKVLISIAAGFTIDKLNKLFVDKKILMTMPNTPAMVNEAMTAICPNEKVTKDETKKVVELFNLFGKATILDEGQFSAFAAACGSLPAFVYMFIEAAADGAVLNGMKRADSYEFIAQTVLGSAKMVLDSKNHPAYLKDMVTSPGGTTIEGVKILEDEGFRSAIIGAINAAVEKHRNM